MRKSGEGYGEERCERRGICLVTKTRSKISHLLAH